MDKIILKKGKFEWASGYAGARVIERALYWERSAIEICSAGVG
jgi:hypothetical protein